MLFIHSSPTTESLEQASPHKGMELGNICISKMAYSTPLSTLSAPFDAISCIRRLSPQYERQSMLRSLYDNSLFLRS